MANPFARYLRKNMTDAERFVWYRIRHCQLGGFRFRRQAPIGPYIADFVCFEAKLILELDGGQHAARVGQDAARTAWLETQGFRVFRVWNFEVFEDWDSIAEAIGQILAERAGTCHEGEGATPHPAAKRRRPPPQGGRSGGGDGM